LLFLVSAILETVGVVVLCHDFESVLRVFRLFVPTSLVGLVALMNFVAEGKHSRKSSLGVLYLGNALLLESFLTRQEPETIEACASEDLSDVLDKSSVEHWSGELNVAEMAWAISLSYHRSMKKGG
jgi:hypothetical protein